jgi:hypothetical protein
MSAPVRVGYRTAHSRVRRVKGPASDYACVSLFRESTAVEPFRLNARRLSVRWC